MSKRFRVLVLGFMAAQTVLLAFIFYAQTRLVTSQEYLENMVGELGVEYNYREYGAGTN